MCSLKLYSKNVLEIIIVKNRCFVNRYWNKGWIVKLPLISTALYIMLSLPFLLKWPIASIHENGAYSIAYIIINIPAIMLFDQFKYKLEVFLNHPSSYSMYLIFFAFSLVFWALVSVVVGACCDVARYTKAGR